MMYHKAIRTLGAIAAVVWAALGVSPPAHADALYKADRAYCMSGQASEARDLCLKEAAAAQAERQGNAHGRSHRKHNDSKQTGETVSNNSAATKP